MKSALAFVMVLAGLAVAAESAPNNTPDLEARFCPVGKACSSNKECGSCSCNSWKGKCEN
ncbi:hypothetical protein MY11210_002712 [Beauveria gryllotalpidicola]